MVMENKKRQKENKEERASTLESLIKSDNDEAVSTYKSLNWTNILGLCRDVRTKSECSKKLISKTLRHGYVTWSRRIYILQTQTR